MADCVRSIAGSFECRRFKQKKVKKAMHMTHGDQTGQGWLIENSFVHASSSSRSRSTSLTRFGIEPPKSQTNDNYHRGGVVVAAGRSQKICAGRFLSFVCSPLEHWLPCERIAEMNEEKECFYCPSFFSNKLAATLRKKVKTEINYFSKVLITFVRLK